MQYTYYGQSCFLIEINAIKILVDPYISHNPLAKNIEIDAIDCNYIFVSHGHADHIADAIAIAKRTNATVVSNWEICEWFNKNGISKTHPMNTGGSWLFEFGKVKLVVAQHSSSLPDGTYGGNPVGFIFYTTQGDYYYSGDTALTLDMQLIPLFANIKACILPIGNNFTMDENDAILASDFVKCPTVVGVHYNTFDFIKINTIEAIQKFTKAGKQLLLPIIGETISI